MTIKYFNNIKTFDELKKAYRDLMKKYHPDLNPDDMEKCTEICKEINKEFEYLFNIIPNQRQNAKNEWYEAKKEYQTPKQYMDIINKIIKYPNIQIDVIGSWLWVSGETYKLRKILKELNFKWHEIRKCWYLKFSKGASTLCNLSLEELQEIYGGESFKTENQTPKEYQKLSFAVSH